MSAPQSLDELYEPHTVGPNIVSITSSPCLIEQRVQFVRSSRSDRFLLLKVSDQIGETLYCGAISVHRPFSVMLIEQRCNSPIVVSEIRYNALP